MLGLYLVTCDSNPCLNKSDIPSNICFSFLNLKYMQIKMRNKTTVATGTAVAMTVRVLLCPAQI